MWDVRDREKHWIQKDWPIREVFTAGMPNTVHDSIVNLDKIVIQPLPIKLSLMKQFLKALNTNGKCFKYLICAIPKLSYNKIKAGMFDGS